jgi:hypothetical protein
MALVVDAAVCARRLKALYSSWRVRCHSSAAMRGAPRSRAEPFREQANGGAWGGAKSFAVARGPPAQDDDHMRYHKSIALHLWLFGYEALLAGACLPPRYSRCLRARERAAVARRRAQTPSCYSRRTRCTCC